jgi:16S rRNA (cytosine1402-N4)-methyltransferase
MYHKPVLYTEVMNSLITSPGGLYLDCTLGGGGHSAGILERLNQDGRLLALDWDADADRLGGGSKLSADERFTLLRMNFGDMKQLPSEWTGFQGILMDLGLSSHQIDTPERGFAFMKPGPLDMRMDVRREGSAADYLASRTEEEISKALFEFGELKQARRLAKALCEYRQSACIDRTEILTEIVEAQFGSRGSYKILAKVFQALRIVVNHEMENLDQGLEEAFARLVPGGRLAVIAYHSLEDRRVKRRFRAWSGLDAPSHPRGYFLADETSPLAYLPVRKAVKPSKEEEASNPRARSARLRVLVKGDKND